MFCVIKDIKLNYENAFSEPFELLLLIVFFSSFACNIIVKLDLPVFLRSQEHEAKDQGRYKWPAPNNNNNNNWVLPPSDLPCSLQISRKCSNYTAYFLGTQKMYSNPRVLLIDCA